MDLLHHIRGEREQLRKKLPLERPLFARISGLVSHFGLGEGFLAELDNPGEYPPREGLELERPRPKEHFEFPLFSLVTEEDFRVTTAIIHRVGNPYLSYAHSGAEILLSRPLFRLNPNLGPDMLAKYHFETLLLAELAKRELGELSAQPEVPGAPGKRGGDPAPPAADRRERSEHLRAFIARVENPEFESGW